MPKNARLRLSIRNPWLFAGMLLMGCSFVFLLLIPQEQVPFMFPKDYMNHGGVFLCLTLFVWFAFNSRWWLQLLVLVLFAFATEFAQDLVPYRHFAWDDLQSNLLGIAIGVSVIGIFKLSNRLITHLHD